MPAPIGHLLGARVRWSASLLAALSVETRRSEARPTPEWPFSCRAFSAVQFFVTLAEQRAPGSRGPLTSTFVESGRRESNSRSQLGKRVQPDRSGPVRTKSAGYEAGAHVNGPLRTRARAR